MGRFIVVVLAVTALAAGPASALANAVGITTPNAVVLPVTGEVVIAKMSQVHNVSSVLGMLLPIPLPRQIVLKAEGTMDLQVAGLPGRGAFSALMTTTVFLGPTGSRGVVDPTVLRTPAGEVPLDVIMENKISGPRMSMNVLIRGGNGTGMFQGVRVSGEFRGEADLRQRQPKFPVSGSLTMSFPSVEAAREAISRGLEANTGLGETERARLQEQASAALAQVKAVYLPDVEVRAVQGKAPEKPVVTHAVSRAEEKTSLTISVTIPALDTEGAEPAEPVRQRLRVVGIGAEGVATIYDSEHLAGQVVQIRMEAGGVSVVQVYLANRLIAEIRIESSSGRP